jgi:hypothetical protein
VTLALAGEYRGTGPEYPPNGFRFTESGTFYRDGSAYATLHPWRAPPQAMGPGEAAASAQPAEQYSPVDAVMVRTADAIAVGNLIRTGKPTPDPKDMALTTLTFVVCEGEIVDRYYKIDNSTPSIAGKSLKAAWDSAVASGLFQSLQAGRHD